MSSNQSATRRRRRQKLTCRCHRPAPTCRPVQRRIVAQSFLRSLRSRAFLPLGRRLLAGFFSLPRPQSATARLHATIRSRYSRESQLLDLPSSIYPGLLGTAKPAAFYSSQLAAAALVARKRLYSLHIVREPWDSRRRAKETSEKASSPPAHRVRAIPFLPYRARARFTHAPSRLHHRLRLRRHHRRASPHSPIPRRHRVCSFFLITAPPSLAQPSTRRGRPS